jgi:predicted transglutaminase-like cysteine proteinase
MLPMATSHSPSPHSRRRCNRFAASGWIVAVATAITMPSQLVAQSAGHPINAALVRECGYPANDLTLRIAKTQAGNIEPSAGPESETNVAAIPSQKFSKLELMRLAQASDSLTVGPEILPRSPGSISDECYNRDDFRHTANIADKPDVPANAILGSVSVPVAHTPFDLKWSAVNAKRNRVKFGRQLAATGARNLSNQADQVEAINRWVNRNVAFGSDRDVYGRTDHWAPAAETFRRGIGDCEDFAIAKMELLATLGISRDKIRLIVARDLVRNSDHALLIVELSSGSVMLDNVTDQLLDARFPNDYSPIMSFSQSAKWVHGYAVQTAHPARIASVDYNVPSLTNNHSDVSTVTVEPEMPALSMALLSVPLVLPNIMLAKT